MRQARSIALLLGVAFLAAPGSLLAATPMHSATFRGLSRAAMIAKAKTAPLRLIDYLETYCDGETTIGHWLTRLTAGEAKSITWSAGKCYLVNNLNPLDEGGDYCVDADIRLKHPLAKDDTPSIEISLDDPKHGQPGEAYAFRDVFYTPDGDDYERDRKTFETQWRDRFPHAPPPPCEDP